MPFSFGTNISLMINKKSKLEREGKRLLNRKRQIKRTEQGREGKVQGKREETQKHQKVNHKRAIKRMANSKFILVRFIDT